jgi:hypothetical protein
MTMGRKETLDGKQGVVSHRRHKSHTRKPERSGTCRQSAVFIPDVSCVPFVAHISSSSLRPIFLSVN